MKHIVMGITGASGAPYARRLIQCLLEQDLHLHLIVSPPARCVIATELELEPAPAGRRSARTEARGSKGSPHEDAGHGDPALHALLGRRADNVTLYPYHELGARIASGSFLTDGMVICPCSGRSLAAIAHGLGDNLISRAAMVMLKEVRRLILVPREMPLSQIDIENMLKLSRAGAIICPACPGFYTKPKTVADLVDFVVGRVLDLFGLPHALSTRWEPTGESGRRPNATGDDVE